MIAMPCCGNNKWIGELAWFPCGCCAMDYGDLILCACDFPLRRRQLAQLGCATGVYKTLVKYLVGVPQVWFYSPIPSQVFLWVDWTRIDVLTPCFTYILFVCICAFIGDKIIIIVFHF